MHANRNGMTTLAARGFSLLELTLVLVIIGLLMGVAAVNLVGGAERAKVKVTKASMKTIQSQLKSFYAEKSKLPVTLDVLVTEQYLDDGTLTDGWDRPFYYLPYTDGSGNFDLVSGGKDGDYATVEDNIDAATLDLE